MKWTKMTCKVKTTAWKKMACSMKTMVKDTTEWNMIWVMAK
jgi:hypothetical protein